MLPSLLLAIACQCGAATPRATVGAIAQTSEAVYVQPERGAPIARVDKTSGDRVVASPPIARAVSAIDVAGGTLYVGTKTSLLSPGTYVYDGADENFVASIDADGLHAIASNLGDVKGLGHDATYLYWAERMSVWRRPLAGGPVEKFAAWSEYVYSMAVDRDAVWIRDASGFVRFDKTGAGARVSTGYSGPPVILDAEGDLFDGSLRYDHRGVTSVLRLPLKSFAQVFARDTPVVVSSGWVIYDEDEFYGPHFSGFRRAALDLCNPAAATNLYSYTYSTSAPYDPPPSPPPIAIDSCGIFVGTERTFCFSQALAIGDVEIFRGGIASSKALRPEGGDVIVIHGRGFDATTTVDVDGRNAPVQFASDSAISVVAPPAAAITRTMAVPLRVRDGAGDCTANLVTVSALRRAAAAH